MTAVAFAGAAAPPPVTPPVPLAHAGTQAAVSRLIMIMITVTDRHRASDRASDRRDAAGGGDVTAPGESESVTSVASARDGGLSAQVQIGPSREPSRPAVRLYSRCRRCLHYWVALPSLRRDVRH